MSFADVPGHRVRAERAGVDDRAIHALHVTAFGRSIEAEIADALRADAAVYVNAASLVAEGPDGRVIGHVMTSRAWIGDAPVLAFGPVGVVPTEQGRGVGSALVSAALRAADALAEPAVVLLGDPAFYARFGFVLAERQGIRAPVAAWRRGLQVRTLSAWPQPSGMTGTFRFAHAFDAAS